MCGWQASQRGEAAPENEHSASPLAVSSRAPSPPLPLVRTINRCVDLLDDLHAALVDGTYGQRLKRWARPELLVIDDVDLGQVKKRAYEPIAAHMLHNLVDRTHGKVPTAITSDIALSDWGRYLGDATLTAAILDRLAMHAVRIHFDGPSYQHLAKTRAARTPDRRVVIRDKNLRAA